MKQRTIANPVSFSGVGVHTGVHTTVNILPAPDNFGIVFYRTDIEGSPEIKASIENVKDTNFATSLARDDRSEVKVHTVEHLMAAFFAFGIDNVRVEIDNEEMPIMDGSSADFVFLIACAGIKKQDTLKYFIVIKDKIEVVDKENLREVSLQPYGGFCVNFKAQYDHPAIKKEQSYSHVFSHKSFVKEIARSRTFSFYKDIEKLRKMGLVKGGSLSNAIIIGDDAIMNEGGLRYTSELGRHKIIDVIGDLYLLGHPIVGLFEGVKSGHDMNNKISNKLLKETDKWEKVKFNDSEMPPIAFE